ncbi:hypothetical protein ACP70R_002478 [Stipagrostis hirtigluma subsp. patula]
MCHPSPIPASLASHRPDPHVPSVSRSPFDEFDPSTEGGAHAGGRSPPPPSPRHRPHHRAAGRRAPPEVKVCPSGRRRRRPNSPRLRYRPRPPPAIRTGSRPGAPRPPPAIRTRRRRDCRRRPSSTANPTTPGLPLASPAADARARRAIGTCSHARRSHRCTSTHNQDVFCFYPDERPCNGFSEALERYREFVPHLRLAGLTSFAPIIDGYDHCGAKWWTIPRSVDDCRWADERKIGSAAHIIVIIYTYT